MTSPFLFPFTSATALEQHFTYLEAPSRLAAYDRALRALVRPGARVLDLGAGTGILGWLALRAGAGRVTAVEGRAMAGVLRRLVEANGLSDRVTVVKGWSHEVVLPREFDLVVCDQMAPFLVGGGIFEALADARERFLVPGGTLVPSAVAWQVAPVEQADMRPRVDFWGSTVQEYDLSAMLPTARCAKFFREVAPGDLLAEPADLAALELGTPFEGLVRGRADVEVTREGTIDFLAGWFRVRLAPGVELTNSPLDPARIVHRAQALFPLREPVSVEPGDRVRVDMRIDTVSDILAWTVEVEDPRGVRALHRTRASDFEGFLVEAEDLRQVAGEHRPSGSRRGRALGRALDLFDGGRTLGEVEGILAEEAPGLFVRPSDLTTFVRKAAALWEA